MKWWGWALVALVVVAAITGGGDPEPTSDDPLDQMEVAFVGDWSRSDIQLAVDSALRLYGEPVNDDMRSRAGSALVGLRREYGVPEMAMLEHMLCSKVDGVDLSFAEAAGLAATFVAAGDRCT